MSLSSLPGDPCCKRCNVNGVTVTKKASNLEASTCIYAPPKFAPPPSALPGHFFQPTCSRIWPPSLEHGHWPSDYTMSDHGSLTASFRVAPTREGALLAQGSAEQQQQRRSAGTGESSQEHSENIIRSALSEAVSFDGTAVHHEDDDGHYGLR